MEKKEPNEDVKPDLKHDSMDFAASTDGDDVLDTDDATYEEESITAEELELLEDEPENEAAALNAVEIDREADDSIMPEEDWTEDLPDNDPIDEDESEYQR
ncbi:MAG: hypothetical protein EOO03_02700 [Chitinophagaceae bacterium]|nr:MAG: hypothetical protein EOO03_02700 [Chitinophagaceae bacterium]